MPRGVVAGSSRKYLGYLRGIFLPTLALLTIPSIFVVFCVIYFLTFDQDYGKFLEGERISPAVPSCACGAGRNILFIFRLRRVCTCILCAREALRVYLDVANSGDNR